jgi:hypothetical protein
MKRKRASGAWCWTKRGASLQEMMQYQCGQFRHRKAKPQVVLDQVLGNLNMEKVNYMKQHYNLELQNEMRSRKMKDPS